MILVIGEALIDLIENRYQPGAFNAIVGGANANVALALARRGADHAFYARISRDRFGDIIRKRLDDNDVLYGNSITTNDNSTLAIVSLNEAGSPTYSFYVNGTADWGWTPDELPTNAELTDMGIKCIQFGCLTMAMEPGNLVIEDWAKQTQGITISHDINIRAALGFDPEHERIRVERVNEFRLITRGADGTSLFRGDERIDVPSRKINVVDTVGAGDTFCANLLGQLQDEGYLGTELNQIPSDALRNFVYVAGIAASITCERAGCEPPTLEELLGFF
jgi:fructokinase